MDVPRTHTQTQTDTLRIVAAVAVVIGVLGLAFSRWLSGFQWDNDEGTLVMWARLMGEGYRLYTDIWSDQPPGLALSLLTGFQFLGQSIETARLVVLLYGLVCLAGVAALAYQVAQDPAARPGGRWRNDAASLRSAKRLAAVAAPLVLALTPNFFWLTRSVSHDVPPAAVGTLAVALTAVYVARGRYGWLVAAGALLCWGLWLKFTAVVFAAPVLALLALRAWRVRERKGELLYAVLALGAGGLPVALPLVLFFDARGFFEQAVVTPLAARDAWGADLAQNRALITTYLFTQNPILTALAALGATILVRRREGVGVVTVGWTVVALVILANQSPLFPTHHFMLLLPPLAVLAAQGVAATWQMLRARGDVERWQLALMVIVVAISLSRLPQYVADMQEAVAPTPRRAYEKAAGWLASSSRPDDLVLADPVMIAFRAQRNAHPWLTDLGIKRIQPGLLTDEEAIARLEQSPPAAIAMGESGRIYLLRGTIAWIKQRYVPILRESAQHLWVPFSPDLIQRQQPGAWGDVAEILGYDLEIDGDKAHLQLYLRALGKTDVDYAIAARLVGPDGMVHAEDRGPVDEGHAPSKAWLAGQYVVDRRSLTLPAGAAGPFFIDLVMLDEQSGAPLPALDGAGQVLGPAFRLLSPVP